MQIKIAQFHYSRLCRMILATIFTILLSIPITAPNVSALPNTAIKPMVAVGNNHTLILRGDGTVWAVGRNDFGQLGDGTRIDKLSPVQVEGLTDVVWIAARGWVSFAVKSDGTIWAWGSNQEGQLGISGTNSSPTPVKNPNITDVREVKTNGSFVLALKKDASLWAWGQNQFGQLGNGTPNEEPNPYPIQVQGMKNIKTFETAIDAALAVKSDGTVWAWGRNDSGQLGIGSTVDQHSPIQVESLVDVVQFATGWFYTLALKSDGTVWSFGLNNGDQLGIKTEEKNSTSPKPITGLNNIVSISAGEEFGMALDGNGQLWGWGERLMPGDQLSKYMPKNIMSNVSGIISNLHSKIAMKEDGSVLAWGFNENGNLLDGTTVRREEPTKSFIGDILFPLKVQTISPGNFEALDSGYSNVELIFNEPLMAETITSNNFKIFTLEGEAIPAKIQTSDAKTIRIIPNVNLNPGQFYYVLVDGILNLKNGLPMGSKFKSYFAVSQGNFSSIRIAAGSFQNLAITGDYRVWSWGENSLGQLGVGTNTARYRPVPIPNLKGITTVSTGISHSAAIRVDGTLWIWGSNEHGQLGNPSIKQSAVPIQVPHNDYKSVAVGNDFTIALKKDGTVWSWGSGRPSPTVVPGLSNIIAIDAGAGHSLALKDNGTVWAWGDNSTGQLGIGNTEAQRHIEPVQVGLSEVKAITAGANYGLAIKNDGTVWGWGDNQYYGISFGNPKIVSSPIQVKNLEQIHSISAGFAHNLALKQNGTVWTWGDNSLGQLGDGSNDISIFPKQVANVTGVKEVEAGYFHSIIQKQDGSIWSWGYNGVGQLGTSKLENQFGPVQSMLSNNPVSHRIYGQNRIETATAISKQGWNSGTFYVVLARDDDFPDALTGTTLAHLMNAPILLTNKSILSSSTEMEIERLGASNVIILGGTGAVSTKIEETLRDKGIEVTRIGGRDRFETSANIAMVVKEILGPDREHTIVLANGRNFPDALAISSWAAFNKIPIFLTEAKQLPKITREAILEFGYPSVIAVGGEGVISQSVFESVSHWSYSKVRYGGKDRYETAVKIAEGLQTDASTLFIATGRNFPDALAGSCFAAKTNSPIILTDNSIAPSVKAYLQKNMNITKNIFVFGGESVVSSSVVNSIIQFVK